jgi:oxaloacetate decarboxylase gamma subunit
MQGDLVAQGVELVLYGMGTVVVFLALLVAATTAMSRTVARYFPEPTSSPAVPLNRLRRSQQRAGGTVAGESPEERRLVAVIGAAIHRHRAGER